MGERINFPKKYEHYIALGNSKLNQGDLDQAIDYFEEAYAMADTRHANVLLFSAYLDAERYDEAVETAEARIEDYEDEDYLYFLYIQALIYNQHFLKAEALIKRMEKEREEPLEASIFEEMLEALLEDEKEKMLQREEVDRERIYRQLYAIGDLPVEGQMQALKDASQLPAKQMIDGLKSVLINPFCIQLVKSSALIMLKDIQYGHVVDFDWFQKREKVLPKDLADLGQSKIYRETHQLLADRSEKNPSMYIGLEGVMEVDFLALYPYIDEVVTDATSWMALYEDYFDKQEHDLTGLDSKMLAYFKELRKVFL